MPDPMLMGTMDAFAATVTVRADGEGQEQAAVQTAVFEATKFARQSAATLSAQQAADQSARQATATLQAPVVAELPLYGVDPGDGRLGWVHEPVTLTMDGYRSGDFANDYAALAVQDFALAADITWDTKYGASGCGFALRSNGEAENPSQYIILLSRLANGHAYFLAQADGKIANFRNFYANWLDPQFAWQNGSANRLAVVGRGSLLSVYSNYTLIGEIDTTEPPPPKPNLPERPERPKRPTGNAGKEALAAYQSQLAQYPLQLEAFNQLVNTIQRYHKAALQNYASTDTVFEEGFVGMLGFAYSGYVTCRFDDAWLWLIGE